MLPRRRSSGRFPRNDLRRFPRRLPRYGFPLSRIPAHGAVFCRFHPSFCASCLHHKTHPVLLWIPDKEEGSLPGNLSDPFPAALFSYGYVGMEVLPPQQAPGQTDRSSFLPHQRRTANHLWNPAFLCVFRNDSCSLCVPVRSAARCSHSGYPAVPAS